MSYYKFLVADESSSTVRKGRIGKHISKGLAHYHMHHTSESGVESSIAAYKEKKAGDSMGVRRVARGGRPVMDSGDMLSRLQDLFAGTSYSVEQDGSTFWVPLGTTEVDGHKYTHTLQLLTKNDGEWIYSARIIISDEDDNMVGIVVAPVVYFDAAPYKAFSKDALKFLDSYWGLVQGVELERLEQVLTVPALGGWVDVYLFDEDDDDEESEE